MCRISGIVARRNIVDLHCVIKKMTDRVRHRGPDGLKKLRNEAWFSIELPRIDPFVAPILYAIPVQFLAYRAAVYGGTDIDQPRNVAKSVTVE